MDYEQFEKYLKKKQKRGSGDHLQKSTIKLYLYNAKRRLFDKNIIEKYPNVNELVDWMNTDLRMDAQYTVYSTYRSILIAMGYKRDIYEKIEYGKILHTALRSYQFLQTKIFSKREIREILDKIPDFQEKLLIKMFFDTAARRKEVMRMKIKNINWKEKELTSISVIGKGNKFRDVYIQKSTEKFLKEHIKRNNIQPDDRIFNLIRKDGKLYGNNYPQEDFERLQEQGCYDMFIRYGIQFLDRHMTPHCYRHSAAQSLADDGVELMDICAILGHSKISTTEIYAKVSEHRRKMAFNKYVKDVLDVTDEGIKT